MLSKTKFLTIRHALVVAFTAVAAFVGAPARAQLACLPTCQTNPNDAKFLAIAGDGLATLSERNLEFEVIVPAGIDSFTVGVFDGDSGSTTGGSSRWDFGPEAAFTYTLLADPTADGTGAVPVDLLPGQSMVPSTMMADNGWTDFTVSTSGSAMAPSGNYFYRFRVEGPPVGGGTFINSFKVRSSGVLTVEMKNQPFSYIAASVNIPDLMEVFPAGTPTPTTYDGEWRFYFDVPEAQTELEVFDGDFDHGNADGSESDTDDPNSDGLPAFSMPAALPEGVAKGAGLSTGDPPDDVAHPYFVRPGTVSYSLLYPDGQLFVEANPSGNQEWERFVGSLSGAGADYVPTAIPAGQYELRSQSVDYFNLNALRLPFRLVCVDVYGDACVPLRPYLIGDRVYFDGDQSGSFTEADSPIESVVVNLLDRTGAFIASTLTDAHGVYAFEVQQGTHRIEVDASNFNPGGALEGMASTTGGETQSKTVSVDNVLTYDFGYFSGGADGSIGDFVWFDQNGNGLQDEPTASGLANVSVQLIDETLTLIDTQDTDANGAYRFTGLGAGTYIVNVVESTLPSGGSSLTLTTGNEPMVVNLGLNESLETADLGYTYTPPFEEGANFGGRVWNDLDGNGQDLFFTEPSLNGVVVTATGDIDGDGSADYFNSAVTAGAGFYFFSNVAPGSYTSTVDFGTVPAGLTERTFDFDGVTTPDTTTLFLGPGSNLLFVNFGYREP